MLSRKKYEKISLSLQRIVGVSDVFIVESVQSVPCIVVLPETTQEVSKIMRLATTTKLSVTVQSRGFESKKQALSERGGIVLVLSKMQAMEGVFPEDMQVSVQPGMLHEKLNVQLQKTHGLFFPPALGSSSQTIGGVLAENTRSMHAVKYGHVRDWVLSLEIVLADGKVIRTGSRSFVPVLGYDLTALFMGSAGTLGIITEATLRLSAIPDAKTMLFIAFRDVSRLTAMTLALLKTAIRPEAIEFLDASYMVLINQAKAVTLPEKPVLIIELSGDKKEMAESVQKVRQLSKKYKAVTINEYKTAKQQAQLHAYKYAVRPKLANLLPHTAIHSFALSVPLSQIPGFLKKADGLAVTYGLQIIMFGHIGGGTIQGWIVYERDNKKAQLTVVRLMAALIKLTLSLGGTITGEYGTKKKQFLPPQAQARLSLMRGIKKHFDPKAILNPDKLPF